jgi:hypothetical protein
MLPDGALAFMTLGPSQSDNGWGFSLCGSQVACFPWGDYADGGTHGWFVVSRGYSTTLLAIVLSAGYALVVRELRQINANLEQLIELGAVARRHDEPLRGSPHQDIGWNTQNTYR